MVLKQRIEEEVEGVREVLGESTVMASSMPRSFSWPREVQLPVV